MEILETVEPEPQVVAALRRLKGKGYVLALYDFIFQPGMEPFLDLADIVKVGFMGWPRDDNRQRVERLKAHGPQLLAEKVETQQDYDLALQLGFYYFQGYFFSRPVMVNSREVPPAKVAQLRLLQALNNPELNLVGLEKILKADLGQGRPDELVASSLMRAHLDESLAEEAPCAANSSTYS